MPASRLLPKGAVWFFRTAIAAAVLSVIAMTIFREDTHILAGTVFQPRDGCTLGESVRGAWQAVQTRWRLQSLYKSSAIIKRDAAGYTLWRTPHGDYWAPDKDYSLFLVLAELERNPYGENRHELLYGKVVLDCGAHLGVFTRQALAAGAKLVIAIEPGPPQVQCLRRTFAREIAEGRVAVEPSGVWDEEGSLDLRSGSDTATSSVAGLTQGEAVKVPVTTIDRMVGKLRLGTVGFIKMDIEGAEPEALAGASRTLRESHPALAVAAYHRPGDHRRILGIVTQIDPRYRSAQVGCRVDLGVSVPLTLMFE